jgi:hypothetical protein
MFTEQIPNLATLHDRPSWCNSQLRPDRAAAFEVRASALWRSAAFRPAPSHLGRVSTAIVNLPASFLADLHNHLDPRRLAGDFRSGRSHAMRPQSWGPPRLGGKKRPGRIFAPGAPDHLLCPNPNKGACREKMLGFPPDWSQPLRLEMWKYNLTHRHRLLLMPFLICPNASPNSKRPDPDDPRLPPLSNRPREGFAYYGKCPQRVQRLFGLLCTQREIEDALTAQNWLASIPPRLELRPFFAQARQLLTTRYAPLFHPRTLLCRRCLGLRYGNRPATLRAYNKSHLAPPM